MFMNGVVNIQAISNTMTSSASPLLLNSVAALHTSNRNKLSSIRFDEMAFLRHRAC